MSSRRDPEGNESSSRQNVYFLPRDGIDREVITSDICRYLGNDALVRPGTYQDPTTGNILQGYHITGYRNLTTAMIQDLKQDSARWEQERRARTGASGNRKSGPTSASSYPGSSAPGYSGFPQQYQSQPDSRQDPRQPAHQPGQYNQGHQTTQNQDPRYMQPSSGGAYSSNTVAYSAPEHPYVNVGAHQYTAESRGGYPGSSYPAAPAYGAPGPDPRYYAQAVDPHYGRSNSQYPVTTQTDYSPPANYGYDHQTASQTQAPAQPPTPSAYAAVTHAAVQDPRATTSSPVGTQAQTGYSAPSSSTRERHRDRDHRDSRHSRR